MGLSRKLFLVLLPLSILACSGSAQKYVGRLLPHREGLVFQQCGGDTQWWLAMDSASQAAATRWVEGKESAARDTVGGQALLPQIYVALKGGLAPPGSYGPGGAFTRVLTVTEIVEIRGLARGECF